MAERKNIFISHVHEDDGLLPKFKELVAKAELDVSDYSINSSNPNDASSEDYIKREILAPRIQACSTMVVLITHDTAPSPWVNWEIQYAIAQGKNVVGVFAQGATDADIPEELAKHAAAIVGWNSERIVDAINGAITGWDDPATNAPRAAGPWKIERYDCA
jgi:nucleoside 2-deoxyribosyltransferase